MNKILIDSGPLIAFFDASDKYHQRSIEFIKDNTFSLVNYCIHYRCFTYPWF